MRVVRPLPLLAPPRAGDAVADRPPAAVRAGTLVAARHVAEALFAGESGPPEPGRIDRLVVDLADFLGRTSGRGRMVMGLCLFFLTWIAPLLRLRFGPLGALPVEERLRTLAKVEAGSFAPAVLAPKAILCFLWFETAETQRETGTVPSCLRS